MMNGKINPAFSQDSQSTYTRSGVGIAPDGSIFFAISNAPVTFYEFASLFKEELDAANALYLDGAISEMYIPEHREETANEFSTIIGIAAAL